MLATDEMLGIMTYIVMQAKIKDFSSQFDLMTAFASDYMQEGQDCKMA